MGPTTAHLFRISTSTDYSTVTNCSDTNYWNITSCTDNGNTWTDDGRELATYDEEGFDAAALDVNLACGQCHGGGAGPAKPGIMSFDKATLSVYAAGMHTASKLPPTVGNTALVSPVLKGTPVSFIDASKDNNHQSIASVYVNWGDGQTTSGAAGATFSHTYCKRR